MAIILLNAKKRCPLPMAAGLREPGLSRRISDYSAGKVLQPEHWRSRYNQGMNEKASSIAPLEIDTHIRELIGLAVTEDMGQEPGPCGDPTTELSIEAELQGSAALITREAGVLAGTFLIPEILSHYSRTLAYRPLRADGDEIGASEKLGIISGSVAGILSSERLILNFVGRLSGVASLTRVYVNCARKHGPGPDQPVICDTRKTTPGFRALEKYAVRCGGGVNHRMALYDGVMLKDNHLAALGTRFPQAMPLSHLVRHVRQALRRELPLWLEIDSLNQLSDAIAGGPDIILLDNMSPKELLAAVAARNRLNATGRPLLEASGGITLENLPAYARTGVDRISIGALTHSAPALDLSLEMDAA